MEHMISTKTNSAGVLAQPFEGVNNRPASSFMARVRGIANSSSLPVTLFCTAAGLGIAGAACLAAEGGGYLSGGTGRVIASGLILGGMLVGVIGAIVKGAQENTSSECNLSSKDLEGQSEIRL